MPTLNYLPPWSIDYAFEVVPDVIRGGMAYPSQRAGSNKRIVMADVTRRLVGAELPYFEWFIREICSEGSLAFTDYYADGDGVASGTIRIVDGAYSVSTNLRRHIVQCRIEIFR
jgi:hypothetical protein